MSFDFGNQLNVTAQINAVGLAKDTSVQAVKTTLGTPAQDATVGGVTTAVGAVQTTLGTPAQTADVNAVRTTLGTPAQTADVVTTLPANITGGKKLSDLNTTLGAPAQDSTVATTVGNVTSAVNLLHTAGKTVAAEIGTTSLTGTGLMKDVTGSAINTTLGTPAQTGDVVTTLPANIAATGAPLLALSTTPTNGGNPGVQTFTAGQVRTYGQMTMNQVSYEISLSVLANASDTSPYMFMALEWSDIGTGLIIARENWYFGASSSTANLYSGTGRCKGSQLKITLHWLGSLTSGNCQMLVTRTSRIYTRDDFRSVEGFFGIANVTSGTYDPDGGVILSTSPTIGAGSTASRAMSLYSGTARLNATTQTGAGVVTILNTGQAAAQGLTSSIVFSASIPSGGSVNGTFNLPRGNCICQLVNNGASSQSIIAEIIISEQDI